MNESIIGLLVAVITLFVTNILSYYFAIKKEVRLQATQYKLEMLDKVYTPIYKLLIIDIAPGEGYECIDDTILKSIIEITESNFNLVDPKLNSIIWKLKEEMFFKFEQQRNSDDPFTYYDEDRVLFNHIEKYHNHLRKSLGFPSESKFKGFREKISQKIKLSK